MAATVRFANGRAIDYNEVTEYEAMPSGHTKLICKDRRGKRTLDAILPPGSQAILEFADPCAITHDDGDIAKAVETIMALKRPTWREAEELKGLKAWLRKFNATTGALK